MVKRICLTLGIFHPSKKINKTNETQEGEMTCPRATTHPWQKQTRLCQSHGLTLPGILLPCDEAQVLS